MWWLVFGVIPIIKSLMAAKILCHSLELELLYGSVPCLVQRNNPTLDVCWLLFCVIMIIKTFSWYFSFAHFGYYQNLEYGYTAQILSFVYARWPWEKSQENCFSFFNKIQDGWRITCYSEELELLHWFVPRKQLTLVICWIDFGVILTSHFHLVYIKIWWQYCISL